LADSFIPPQTLINMNEVDQHNTDILSAAIEEKLMQLTKRENEIWGNYELGDDFKCDYLNCQSITISLYYVKRDKMKDFEDYYKPKMGNLTMNNI
jgi:hypothetical protein